MLSIGQENGGPLEERKRAHAVIDWPAQAVHVDPVCLTLRFWTAFKRERETEGMDDQLCTTHHAWPPE